jgi:hypothetical protein
MPNNDLRNIISALQDEEGETYHRQRLGRSQRPTYNDIFESSMSSDSPNSFARQENLNSLSSGDRPSMSTEFKDYKLKSGKEPTPATDPDPERPEQSTIDYLEF